MKKSEVPELKSRIEKANKTSPAKYFIGGFFSASLIFIALSVIFTAGYYFNIGDFRGRVIEILGIEKEQQSRLEYRESEINRMMEEVELSINELKADQKIYDQRTALLEEKENELIELEARLSGEQMEISRVIAIYNEMEPQLAAEILSLNPKSIDTTSIIKNLDEKKAASILSYMKPETASLILEVIKK